MGWQAVDLNAYISPISVQAILEHSDRYKL